MSLLLISSASLSNIFCVRVGTIVNLNINSDIFVKKFVLGPQDDLSRLRTVIRWRVSEIKGVDYIYYNRQKVFEYLEYKQYLILRRDKSSSQT